MDMDMQLLKLCQEADKNYVQQDDLNKKQLDLVQELVDIQKNINKVKEKIDAFKDKKSELDPIIADILKKLNADGIALEKALVYLQGGKTVPSFMAVYKAVEEVLKPAVQELLTQTYEKLTKERDPSVVVKVESKMEEGLLGDVVAWLKGAFAGLVDKVGVGIAEMKKAFGPVADNWNDRTT